MYDQAIHPIQMNGVLNGVIRVWINILCTDGRIKSMLSLICPYPACQILIVQPVFQLRERNALRRLQYKSWHR